MNPITPDSLTELNVEDKAMVSKVVEFINADISMMHDDDPTMRSFEIDATGLAEACTGDNLDVLTIKARNAVIAEFIAAGWKKSEFDTVNGKIVIAMGSKRGRKAKKAETVMVPDPVEAISESVCAGV